MAIPPPPKPTPFIPDVSTFLKVLGRGLSAHASKIPSWEALFTLSSAELKELGVEPPRSRRYLLTMREKFRNGVYGIGGECHHVKDGVAELRVVDVHVPGSKIPATATQSPGMKKVIVNVAPGSNGSAAAALPVKGVKVQGARTIVGPHVEHVKGGNGAIARIVAKEGLWEVRRGHKVDGGERRQAEVRAKRRAAENKK
ncbi:hypothetical protein K490DRAFT_75992 [Saccharata proteae CBS 121410]|uniref:Small ribosomal subunit protein mS41 n=1 Tax=Saccharata proteae CBS 121410 TaxID=1314787 RepID=A0A9P4HQP0_9PEZI|nr:hypothetical protein K490DRAFT_75992 [Saccharata proteae CBS 121410]